MDTRFYLVVAMIFSLWPAAAVGAMILAGPEEEHARNTLTPTSSKEIGSSSLERETEDEGSEFDGIVRKSAGEKLARIHADLRRLVSDTQNAGVTEGEPMPETENRANGLARRLGSWEAVYSEFANSKDGRVVDAMGEIALTLKVLAANPTQETFDAFNAAIDEYNASIS